MLKQTLVPTNQYQVRGPQKLASTPIKAEIDSRNPRFNMPALFPAD